MLQNVKFFYALTFCAKFQNTRGLKNGTTHCDWFSRKTQQSYKHEPLYTALNDNPYKP